MLIDQFTKKRVVFVLGVLLLWRKSSDSFVVFLGISWV